MSASIYPRKKYFLVGVEFFVSPAIKEKPFGERVSPASILKLKSKLRIPLNTVVRASRQTKNQEFFIPIIFKNCIEAEKFHEKILKLCRKLETKRKDFDGYVALAPFPQFTDEILPYFSYLTKSEAQKFIVKHWPNLY